MNKRSPGLMQRILIGTGFPALIALALFYIKGGGGLRCAFYSVTGLYCPGCGSGRALSALLNGHPLQVFSYNCMLVFLGIPCMGILVHEYLRIVFPGLGFTPVRISQKLTLWLCFIVIAFWILRNIPIFSFLAPA